MSYTYRGKGTADQRAEQQRQKLNRSILTYRQATDSTTARIGVLQGQIDRQIAQAIWEDVDVRIVASAAGITVASARSVGLEFEDLPRSGSTGASHVQTLRALTRRAGTLTAELEELRRQQEQLVIAALATGTLEAPQVAAISGLTLERVHILARQNTPERIHPEADTGRDLNAHHPPKQPANLGDEKKQ